MTTPYTFSHLFTDAEIGRARTLFEQFGSALFVQRFAQEVITDAVVHRINVQTSMDHDRLLLAVRLLDILTFQDLCRKRERLRAA